MKKAMSVSAFCRDYAVGKTTAYKLAKIGKIKMIKAGRKTLITAESANALIGE